MYLLSMVLNSNLIYSFLIPFYYIYIYIYIYILNIYIYIYIYNNNKGCLSKVVSGLSVYFLLHNTHSISYIRYLLLHLSLLYILKVLCVTLLLKVFVDCTCQKHPPEVFLRKDVLRNFTIFTGKHLCQSLFFNTALDYCFWLVYWIHCLTWSCRTSNNYFDQYFDIVVFYSRRLLPFQ